jgi:hypothetical protein
MKPKRSAVKGPLVTFGLMIGSVLVVVAVARLFDTPQKPAPQTVQASSNGDSASSNR